MDKKIARIKRLKVCLKHLKEKYEDSYFKADFLDIQYAINDRIALIRKGEV